MPKNQKRLGRGLSSLISVTEEALKPPDPGMVADSSQRAAALINLDQLRPNPFQPRGELAPERLKSLADSIRQRGLLQPIIVRPKADNLYEIVAGERRWRAGQMAGLREIPAIVRHATDEEMLEIALVENIFREDLNAIERAKAYRRYCEEFNLSAEEVANRLGEDRSTVANYLRLLELPGQVKEWVAAAQLAMGHARCLLAIKSPSDLVRIARHAIDQGLSVRAVEKLVRRRVDARLAASRGPDTPESKKRPQIRSLEEAFTRSLGTKVEINESRPRGTGRIVIHYYSLDDFDALRSRLGVETEEL